MKYSTWLGAIFSIVFLLVFFEINAQAQSGFLAPSLPSASSFTVRKLFDINNMGAQLPFDESNTVIFADKIKIQDLSFVRYEDFLNNGVKNIVIIANEFELGANNQWISESSDGDSMQRAGGSLIILCRKLLIDNTSSLSFTGATRKPKDFHASPMTSEQNLPQYVGGGFGSQLLISCEQVVLSDLVLKRLYDTWISAAEAFFKSKEGKTFYFQPVPGTEHLFTPEQIANIHTEETSYHDEMLKFLETYKSLITTSDYNRYKAIYDIRRKIDDSTTQASMMISSIRLSNLNQREQLSFSFGYDTTAQNTFQLGFYPRVSPPKSYLEIAKPFEEYRSVPWIIKMGQLPISILSSDEMVLAVKHIGGGSFFSMPGIFPAGQEIIGIQTGPDALKTLNADQQSLFSQWLVEWIKYKRTMALQAKALGNSGELYKILQAVAEMPRYILNEPYATQYDDVNNQLLSMLSDVQTLIINKKITLDAPYTGTVVPLLAQGVPSKYYLIPNSLLLNGVHSNNNWYYGITENINDPIRTTRISLEGTLKRDPLLLSAINNALSSIGSSLEQSDIPNLEYNISIVPIDGLRSSHSTILGSVVNLSLDVEPEKISNFLFRWAVSGLTYYINWTLPGNPLQSGQVGPFSFRLDHRTGGRIVVDGDQFANKELNGSAKIRLVETTMGRVLTIPDVEVKAGQTVPVPNITLQQNEHISDIPDVGITYDDGSFENTIGHFLIMPTDAVIDHVVINNKIGPIITLQPNDLTYTVKNLEVDIAQVDIETQNANIFSHAALSPAGSDKCQANCQVPRLATLSNRYRITGKINFTDGGFLLLKPQDYTGAQIDITIDNIKLP